MPQQGYMLAAYQEQLTALQATNTHLVQAWETCLHWAGDPPRRLSPINLTTQQTIAEASSMNARSTRGLPRGVSQMCFCDDSTHEAGIRLGLSSLRQSRKCAQLILTCFPRHSWGLPIFTIVLFRSIEVWLPPLPHYCMGSLRGLAGLIQTS